MTKHAQDLAPSLVQPSRKKIPLVLKVFGILLIVVGSLTVATIALSAFGISEGFTKSLSDYDTTTLVIFGVEVALTAVSGVLYIALGVYLLRNKRRLARHALETLIILDISLFLCDVMVYGFSLQGIIASLIRLVLAIALMVYIDPSLSEERELRRKLRDMETRERAEEGTLGRDETGKGYIELDFFNLFWIFVVCCVLGLLIETVYHAIVFGGYQDRAGVLYGPFSPIYGFGAVLMTVALNRFHNKPIVIIFLVSAIIGGAFEYLTSWFMQFAFGIVAWDYTGTFLSIDGRTNFVFMCMWGVLGCLWVKLLLPRMLKLVNMIPWNWRYSVTTVCAALMIANGAMTLFALDSWYQREAGHEPTNAIERFCAEHYDNDFMEHRFQSMSINPDNATRVS
ncbi:putative ABC transporter permease [Slackia piriformis]|uniref:putative ABC transporter permease n=1 Tax=Slackia piriformis TaxID=626934 RepID=UPI0026DA8260|nr:putative ABC transporter permease [Slackia piriformis]MDO5023874.1 putative ABC transporter permease [Slackia piriformis]